MLPLPPPRAYAENILFRVGLRTVISVMYVLIQNYFSWYELGVYLFEAKTFLA